MKGNRSAFRVRRGLLAGAWCAAVVLMGWRSFDIQVVEGDRWKALAAGQHRTSGEVAAPRGHILDREGRELARSQEVFSVSAAPREVTDADHVAGRVATALPLSFEEARRAVTSERAWVVLPGRHGPEVREELEGLRGIYVQKEERRTYPRRDLVRGFLGAVVDGRGAGGVEQLYDDVLQGEPGTRVVARASDGSPIAGESRLVAPPRPGSDVSLTVDLELQEIAHHALASALEETGAEGGDVLVTRPGTGEILAMSSRRADGGTAHLPALASTHEPGSTLKPFTVAGLLHHDAASLDEEVEVDGGRWSVHGRTITDVETPDTATALTLREALLTSSNVGVARMAQRLTREQHYEILRDFGFGVPTGLGLPGEAGGVLRHPESWSRQSSASLAIGYELGATPLQVAMAYGALANGGELMEPRIVREVREPDGRVRERPEPRRVRRVVSPEVAADVREALRGVITDGTGGRADLGMVPVAGKTGTSRAHGPGGYESGGYQASFVGFLPADDPELLVYLRLDRPEDEYYGGLTAAPATRRMLEALVAARDTPLERRALASPVPQGGLPAGGVARGEGTRERPREGRGGSTAFVALDPPGGAVDEAPAVGSADGSPPWRTGTSGVHLVSAPGNGPGAPGEPPGSTVPEGDAPATRGAGSLGEGDHGAGAAGGSSTVEVPELSGLPLREAVRALHARGLRVELQGGPGPFDTVPEAGAEVSVGDTVRLVGEGPP